MARPKKKLKIWRVLILRERARYLGTVKAPDERSGESEAVVQFQLNEDQRKRLVVREQE
jgi:hypothetical protein